MNNRNKRRKTVTKKSFIGEFTRYSALKLSVMAIIVYVGIGLLNIQIFNNSYYSESAKSGSHRFVEEQAPRGNIYDKNGTVIAYDIQNFALTFTEATESTEKFYDTMEKVFKVLKENELDIDDDFPIKLNGDKYEFKFNAIDEEGKKLQEKQFKIDISLVDYLSGEMFEGSSYSKLEKKEAKAVIKEAEKYTAEDTYNFLLSDKKFSIPTGVYSKEDERRMVVVKNSLQLQGYSGYKPITIASTLDREIAFTFEQMLDELPGINVETKPQRYYPYGKMGAAFIGYVSKVNDDEKNVEKGYDASTDIKGASGIEAAYEDRLRGSKGASIVEVNRFGRPISELAKREAYQGQNVHLTVDWKVQEAAENSLAKNMTEPRTLLSGTVINPPDRGAVVALDVKSGGVIAMVSQPTFDPNDFAAVNGLSTEKYNEYYGFDNEFYEKLAKEKGWDTKTISTNDKSNPLNGKNMFEALFPKNENGQREDIKDLVPKPTINYATQSLIPPGSIFKTFTAYAGFAEGVVDKSTTVFDGGYYEDGEGFKTTFPEDPQAGNADVELALEKSSNPYFMEVSKRLYQKFSDEKNRETSGVKYKENGIAAYSWKFGLGADPEDKNAITSTGIEISENFGQVYNHYSWINTQSKLMYISLAGRLKAGEYTGRTKYSFIPINLSINEDSDSEEVKSLKLKIKSIILDGLCNGSYDNKALEENIRLLNDKDPEYNGRKPSDDDYKILLDFIRDQIKYEGYNQFVAKYHSYNASIGQGATNVTPLQIASAYATYLNGGTRYKVHLLDKVTDVDGNVVSEYEPEVIDKMDIDPNISKSINAGLERVIYNSSSFNSLFSKLPVRVGGKTGTATFDNEQLAYGREAYGWFVTYAPAEDPEIVVVSVTFNGHFGKNNAEINYEVMKAYFENK